MKQLLLAVLALVVIIASGVLHGLETDRWGIGEDLTAAAAKLKQLPGTIADWASTDQEMDPEQLKVAGAVGHLARVYKNRQDGRQINVVILCGRPGPMSVHPPTVCFTGAGWSLTGKPMQKSFSTRDGALLGDFWQGDFSRDSAGVETAIRTYWSWSNKGIWQASESPRNVFAGNQHLYKLYITSELMDRTTQRADDELDDFVRLLLPELNTLIRPKS